MAFYLEYINHLGSLQKKSARLVSLSNRLVSLSNHPPLQAGFTITEVLLAGLIMLIAVLISGIGLINLLRSNYRANADSEIQNNLNRTLEFVSDDVRRAIIIADSEDNIKINGEGLPDTDQAVLAFRIPDPGQLGNQPLDQQIVYYTTGPERGLTGPRVLWRYGPNLDENGNYITPADVDSWQNSPVTDMLAEDANNPDCPAGFTQIPANLSDVDGFFACVHKDGNQVILNAEAQVEMTTGDEVNYSVSTRVFPRAACEIFCLANSGGGDDPDGPDSSGGGGPSFDLPKGDGDTDKAVVPILTVAANVKAEVIQGNCSSCSVTTGRQADGWLDGGGPLIGEGRTVEANAGDSIRIDVNEEMSNFGWDDLLNQNVEVYISTSSDSPRPLNNNEILLVFTNPPNSYQVLVTITPR